VGVEADKAWLDDDEFEDGEVDFGWEVEEAERLLGD
jgi:hypothetical protein